ncbi:MAG: DUF2953 domain-containing protein [Lachnospiraceae bacterium]|nr:DUF2953 domain-containing protein [Lachnospiraceae bacterium]
MLHILLLILKIIGIILGTLLAVLLAGLMLALFVPVRYQIEAARTEEEGAPPIEARVKITWLLHLVNIRIQYPADVYLRARIFLFTVFRLPQKQKKDDKKRSSKKERSKSERRKESMKNERTSVQKEEDRPNAEKEENVTPAKSEEQTRNIETAGSAEDAAPENAPKAEAVSEQESIQEPETEREKIPLQEKLKEKIMQIRKIFQKIWYTLIGICDRIKAIWGNIEYYMGIIQSDTFKQAFSLCKDELFSVFSYIMPRKFQADLTIGMDDPAATGKILSYYGMLYPFIGGHVNIIPDFERKRMEGTVFIKGKIRLFTFIKAALRIYFNKDIRKLLKMFKKEEL